MWIGLTVVMRYFLCLTNDGVDGDVFFFFFFFFFFFCKSRLQSHFVTMNGGVFNGGKSA